MKREGFSRASASVRGARRLEWTNGARRLQPSVCFRAGVRKARVDQRSAKASAERLLSCTEWKGSSGRTEREGFSRASAFGPECEGSSGPTEREGFSRASAFGPECEGSSGPTEREGFRE